jgi:23S rRNA pseudouridine1911/1915/1917 synthase
MKDLKEPTQKESPPTLAAHLKINNPDKSWAQIKRAIEQGFIQINGSVVYEPAVRIKDTDTITWSKSPQKPSSHQQSIISDLHVLFHDQHLIVAVKPSGIESVPFATKQQDDFNNASKSNKKMSQTFSDICRKWIEKKEGKKIPPLKTVHRLDKGTSGILVFARSVSAERHLGQQFKVHSIERAYHAIVAGEPKSQVIRTHLVTDRGDGLRGSGDPGRNPKAKPAETHLELIKSNGTISLVKCRLTTGRTHQIRIHLTELGHPLCGDTVYRSPKPRAPKIKDPLEGKIDRILLHAFLLGVTHPVTDEELRFEIQDPPEFNTVF